MLKTETVLRTRRLAQEQGFTDVDGRIPSLDNPQRVLGFGTRNRPQNHDRREIGDGGIEFDSRDHSQIDILPENVTLEEYTRGVQFLRVKSFIKTEFERELETPV